MSIDEWKTMQRADGNRKELLAQLGERVLEIIAEHPKADWGSDHEGRYADIGPAVEGAARSLGLLQEEPQ